ncbi:MAG: 30S ribosome-binding factor RbfA [Gemmatimonadaceae bacterium]|nr:30S ribosome-binding factor RbfA [Gemmatimonadaceae bacterium]NUQ94513.1 30S ribosome-binding factor RbfA [Gemmatimonadaceae bacterium]NUR17922.1 30S ribosome-binding factor RbfA [Gemmatimonadaceae bacterium]NUS97171.1 30S ribosome-binding factor RbfA [Gemmatimonadaceae bacterium]
MAKHQRSDRVAEAIREEVAGFLAEGVKDPRVTALVTVTGVDLTRDLRHAKVFVSILGEDSQRESTLEGLASVEGHLRSRLARALRLRVAPEVHFVQDESVARAARIETLLSQIHTPPAPPEPPADADGEGS